LLPIRAALTTISRKGDQNRYLVEYSNCRQFSGQSTITFGTPVEPASAMPEPPKTAEQQLAAGLSLQIRLASEFKVSQAVEGDVIEGILHADLRNGKTLIAPKGATVRGRVYG
jgi:hypothetical protein